jgi:RNA-directed DNA polymerase
MVLTDKQAPACGGLSVYTKSCTPSDYNPYDPDWEAYGERLRIDRMSKGMWDVQRSTWWLQQDGRCAHCGMPMDVEDELLHDHHIQPVRLGGSESLKNRVLMHAWCHRRIHALGLEVTKPVPARGL